MSPLPPDPYKILGISKDAQIPEIRAAHRKLVLKCHPDKVHDPALKAQKQEEFQKVQQAYELLSDETQRQKYDEKVKLEELRKQFQNKVHVSTPRSSTRHSEQDEAQGTASQASPFHTSTKPPDARYAYTRSSEEELGRGAHTFYTPPRPSRRESSYAEKPSRREMERERERERERDRDAREREREREKDRERRRRQEDAIRRSEKEAKEARRAEKRAREKQRDKEMKRESEDKKRHSKPPYIFESFGGDTVPSTSKSEKKKSSSSRKHDEKRDRTSGREDIPTAAPTSHPSLQRSYTSKVDYATSYIQASRANGGAPPGLQRSATYHARPVQPPAPTPPPPVNGPFAPPPDNDDARRASAKPRRESVDDPRLSRERSYRDPSHEALGDPPVVNASPSTRHTAQFAKASSSGNPMMPPPPPRMDLPRTQTMPPEPVSYSRPPPAYSRSQSFHVFDEPGDYSRGRDRSRMHSQVDLESDSEEMYGRRRDSKHRIARQHVPERLRRENERLRRENVSRYQVDGARSRLHSSYVRHVDPDIIEPHPYYGHPADVRPSMPAHGIVYGATAGAASFPKVRTSKAYGYDDVQYSSYYDRPYHEEYAYA
ncbi:hypothetical protein E4U41_000276 [Claviceps citrina]|nr:hypothetical protein E4U41_000276 [Claviceps citrina]